MTSTVSNYSALIDTAFPVSGRDNDTAGFRNNFINIRQSLDTAANEITSLQIEQEGIYAQLNNATVVGDFYAANIANTVTTNVYNSLTNTVPSICSTITQVWYDTTITNDIVNLQTQITTNTNNITVLQTNYGLISSATTYVATPPPTSKGLFGDKIGMVHANSTTIYICYANYTNGLLDIWAKTATDSGAW
jgi:hypothetical protein